MKGMVEEIEQREAEMEEEVYNLQLELDQLVINNIDFLQSEACIPNLEEHLSSSSATATKNKKKKDAASASSVVEAEQKASVVEAEKNKKKKNKKISISSSSDVCVSIDGNAAETVDVCHRDPPGCCVIKEEDDNRRF